MTATAEDEAWVITADYPFRTWAGLRDYLRRQDCGARVAVEMSESAAPSVVRRIAAEIAANVEGCPILGDEAASGVAAHIGRFAAGLFEGRAPSISVDVVAGPTRGRWNNRDAS